MDFVTGLPRTQRGNDAIWVIMDRLMKSAHFFATNNTYSIERYAQLYVDEIVRLHGALVSIISDRDPRFTTRFWPKLQDAMGTRLHFNTTFHAQTDGQSERTIQTLEDMLRSCVMEFKGSWDNYLALLSLPTTIVISLVLVWHPMRHCMEESVEPQFVGTKWGENINWPRDCPRYNRESKYDTRAVEDSKRQAKKLCGQSKTRSEV